MNLLLQMGHGMQQVCTDLLRFWGDGTIIFSPVNTPQVRLAGLAKTYRSHGGKVVFDPQLYYPKDGADNLLQYDYWPETGMSITDSSTHQAVCRGILAINEAIESEIVIVPGVEMDVNAFDYGLTWMRDSAFYFRDRSNKKLWGTLCLFTEVFRSQQTIEELVDAISEIPVDGYYIVARSSNEEYIISDSIWMMGLVKLIACLKLLKKEVIVAYSNHQGLIAALAHADGIASGNYMNTRQFVPERFKSKKADLDRRKSNWYFHPYAMTEYKADSLDVAFMRGFLDSFRPLGDFDNPFSEMLFRGATPSSTNYNETRSFMHYLHCLRTLCSSLSLNSYNDVVEQFNFLLDNAENLMKQYKTKGLRSQNRDFGTGIEALRIATSMLAEDYGFRLRLDWNQL